MPSGHRHPNPYPRRRQNGVLSYQHRDMAEYVLGRQLSPTEVCHHKNGDKTDWHPDNLMVFSCQTAHMIYENWEAHQSRGRLGMFDLDEYLSIMGYSYIDLELYRKKINSVPI